MIEDFSEAMCFMCHSSQHKEENTKEVKITKEDVN